MVSIGLGGTAALELFYFPVEEMAWEKCWVISGGILYDWDYLFSQFRATQGCDYQELDQSLSQNDSCKI